MNLMERFSQAAAIREWLERLSVDQRILLLGLNGSAKNLAVANAFMQTEGLLLVVTPTDYQARRMAEELQTMIAEPVHLFPVNEVMSAEMAFSSPENKAERIKTLDALLNGERCIVVASTSSIKRKLPALKTWQEAHLLLKEGVVLEFAELKEKLALMGYSRMEQVEKPGDYSVRGSIVDIYPLTTDYPLRIDFFDDEIDTLRYFDVATQRSIDSISEVWLAPASDLIFTTEQYQQAAEKLAVEIEKRKDTLVHSEELASLDEVLSCWSQGLPSEHDAYYVDYLYRKPMSLLEYLPADSYQVIDDLSRIYETERQLEQDAAEWQTLKLEEKQLLHEVNLLFDVRKVMKKVAGKRTYLSIFQKGMGRLKFDRIINVEYRAMQQFYGQLSLLKSELERFSYQKQTVILLVSDEERERKLEQLLAEIDVQAVVVPSQQLMEATTQITIGYLQNGFELPNDDLVVLTEKEIFDSMRRKKPARRKSISNAERIKSYNELQPGDYVVHTQHGIGKYIGMETLEVDGVHQDYMTILYQNDDKLFIPVTQLNLLQKYVASEGHTPKLNKLGGKEWHKTKQRVAGKIEDIADELIQLYAQREAEKGFAFSPDTPEQKQFEDDFPYVETEDQLRSAAEIKRDMEKERPMDRLLVGDVGYGKTEVAMRAVFKAVQDGKQVAFLVPTTILAQQHYETMKDRFEDYPVNVGILNRFHTRSEQKETLAGLKEGQVDVVVGTHRILSKDVVFHDLGLLIIDEEQRFGVKHKERLKQLKTQVDVLTLTATPIPRTLHMSMLGVRDLSVIETPPADRYPVQTYVMERNNGAIREAIEREMARGGQVFYLYNRVETIEEKVHELKNIVPDARIAYAHGQMSEAQLEGVLMDFLEGEYDVLVTTTIIETGVDIPNVNTMFVDHANRMGLSQLYQLRGRVGRSNRIAYAYFMYEPQKVLTEIGEQRLSAIKEFTELGSGFKIAMRDLSIRGAGNLLGSQQHGFIDSVGFDLYSEMLKEAVMRKRGQKTEQQEVELLLEIDAYISDAYIKEERLKIEMYKRIREVTSEDEVDELEDEMMDRFGEYPDEVAYLFMVARLKVASLRAGITKMARTQDLLTVTFSPEASQQFTPTEYMSALDDIKLKMRFKPQEKQMQLVFNLNRHPVAEWLVEVWKFAQAMGQMVAKHES